MTAVLLSIATLFALLPARADTPDAGPPPAHRARDPRSAAFDRWVAQKIIVDIRHEGDGRWGDLLVGSAFTRLTLKEQERILRTVVGITAQIEGVDVLYVTRADNGYVIGSVEQDDDGRAPIAWDTAYLLAVKLRENARAR